MLQPFQPPFSNILNRPWGSTSTNIINIHQQSSNLWISRQPAPLHLHLIQGLPDLARRGASQIRDGERTRKSPWITLTFRIFRVRNESHMAHFCDRGRFHAWTRPLLRELLVWANAKETSGNSHGRGGDIPKIGFLVGLAPKVVYKCTKIIIYIYICIYIYTYTYGRICTGKHLDLPALVGGHLRMCWKRDKNGRFLHHG
jgi:hypothetical protein